jgi:2-keto-4-pentenoate hydratase/2-oxohepta-3-ene-1,7-dioic acid hydratase in catechol pathway
MNLSDLRFLLPFLLLLSQAATAASTRKPDVLVFSMMVDEGQPRSVLVLGDSDAGVDVVDLSLHFETQGQNPLALVEAQGFDAIAALAFSAPVQQVSPDKLSLLPILGESHLAAGTNYADHQEETESSEVFLFPKYGRASSGSPEVATGAGVLLDYEIEICAIFDRDIGTMADFQSAVKGFYLCSDFTDRAMLLRLLDITDMGSGVGFTDAKSGDDRFAVADRLVVARDWRQFVDALPLRLSLNGTVRQEALGGDMILKLDDIVERALAEGHDNRWRYRGEPVTLLEDDLIPAGQSVLTGTPGGVLMQIPSAGYLILKFFKWLFTLAWLDVSLYQFIVNEFVADAENEGSFLQAGDQVHMEAGVLGELTVTVTGAPP